ncbi:MAG: hypothetical protein QF504_05775 [Nitrospinaceae bacterium]|nr:hypothetical protein [Nitrospinaceae bacterium]
MASKSCLCEKAKPGHRLKRTGMTDLLRKHGGKTAKELIELSKLGQNRGSPPTMMKHLFSILSSLLVYSSPLL